MTDFVKGSSKPKTEETFSDKIRKLINPNLCFKQDGKKVTINDIKDILIDCKEGDYLFGSKDEHWNIYFEGNANISFPKQNGDFFIDNKKINGYANKNNEGIVESISNIYIYDLF